MFAKVVVVLVVSFLNIGISPTLSLHLKAGIINGDNVGNPVVEDDGQTIYLPDGEYPYMASVEVDETYYSGGVIVHKSVVLTAAHCINYYNVSVMSVRAGTMYRGGTRDSRQVSKISHLWYHPYFQSKYYENDIGILFLETPFDFNKYVNKINIEYNQDYIGETLTALGFGWTIETGGGDINLKKADLTVISTLECRKRAPKYSISKYALCAAHTNGEQSLCFGDSGGPFVKHYPGHPEKDFLVGIISWIGGSCDPKGVSGFASMNTAEYYLRDEFYKNKIWI